MTLFSSIMHKVFGASNAPPPGAGGSSTGGLATAASMPGPNTTGLPPGPAEAGMGAAPISPPPLPDAATASAPVDVEAVLTELAAPKGGGGNWQASIVDLLKLLDLDSGLAARKTLAEELNIHAGADGSAEQNMALSRAVWQELARNGGHVPESLKG
jgi:hypothetical protein